MKENENEDYEIYTLSPEDLTRVANTLAKLNELQKDVFLDIPDRMVIRSFEEWMMPIGYVVSIDDGWYFEAITVKEQERIGKL
jgi:hypothetical protein